MKPQAFSRSACVGRAPAPAVFDFEFPLRSWLADQPKRFVMGFVMPSMETKHKQGKGGGQECPPHTQRGNLRGDYPGMISIRALRDMPFFFPNLGHLAYILCWANLNPYSRMATAGLGHRHNAQNRYQQESSNAQDPGLPVPQRVVVSIVSSFCLISSGRSQLPHKSETASAKVGTPNRCAFSAASPGPDGARSGPGRRQHADRPRCHGVQAGAHPAGCPGQVAGGTAGPAFVRTIVSG